MAPEIQLNVHTKALLLAFRPFDKLMLTLPTSNTRVLSITIILLTYTFLNNRTILP
jgi:hypothetical protein